MKSCSSNQWLSIRDNTYIRAWSYHAYRYPIPSYQYNSVSNSPHTNLSYWLLWYHSPQITSHSAFSSLCILMSHTTSYFHVKPNLNKNIHTWCQEHLHSLYFNVIWFIHVPGLFILFYFLFVYLFIFSISLNFHGFVVLKERHVWLCNFSFKFACVPYISLHTETHVDRTFTWHYVK